MEGEAVCMHIIHPSIKRVIECTRGTTTSDEGHARASDRGEHDHVTLAIQLTGGRDVMLL